MTSACSIFPARISSTVMSPAESANPHARAPTDIAQDGRLSLGGRTPVPLRSAAAPTEQVHAPFPTLCVSQKPHSFWFCRSTMQRWRSVPWATTASGGIGRDGTTVGEAFTSDDGGLHRGHGRARIDPIDGDAVLVDVDREVGPLRRARREIGDERVGIGGELRGGRDGSVPWARVAEGSPDC